jgi:hypothetical protein
MEETPRDENRGAQKKSPAQREAERNPANVQDFGRPAEGRDVPPADQVEKGKRSPRSPWMGGG